MMARNRENTEALLFRVEERGFTISERSSELGCAGKTWAFSTVAELAEWLLATHSEGGK